MRSTFRSVEERSKFQGVSTVAFILVFSSGIEEILGGAECAAGFVCDILGAVAGSAEGTPCSSNIFVRTTNISEMAGG